MTENQKNVLAYLAIYCGGAISPTEIGRQVGGHGRRSAWGSPICKRLVEMGYAERTDDGHYCITVAGHAILQSEHERLRQFAQYVLMQDGDVDGGAVQDKAEELGLIELRPCKPEDSIDGETEHYFLVWL